MSYFFDLENRQVRCDSPDEMRQVFGELRSAMNGSFPTPRATAPADSGIDPSVGNGTATATKKRRQVSAATKAAMRRSYREAAKLAEEKGVSMSEARQIIREIKDGVRTPTGRVKRTAK